MRFNIFYQLLFRALYFLIFSFLAKLEEIEVLAQLFLGNLCFVKE